MTLIGFEKQKRNHDPRIAPIGGSRGDCVLCGSFSELTDSHILPKAAGNRLDLLAHSYGASAGDNLKRFTARRFKNGISFKTLCRDCNSRLGDNEDREITAFYEKVRRALASPLRLPDTMKYAVRPNKLARGILAHMLSTADNGFKTSSDKDIQEVFAGRKHVGEIALRVFYWPYVGSHQSIIRNVAKTKLGSGNVSLFSILKMAPLAFAVTDSISFEGLPSLTPYLTRDDETQVQIPLHHYRLEAHEHWPAAPSDDEIILTSESQMGLVALPFGSKTKKRKR